MDEIGLAQSTVSEHLRILRAAGIITAEIERPRVCYSLNTDRLLPLAGLLNAIFEKEARGELSGSICCPTPTIQNPTCLNRRKIMTRITVYDPAMCCSTGVCGPEVDPKLAQFTGDLDWLKSQGIEVRRFNLAQEPASFVENPAIKAILERSGGDELPAIVVERQGRFQRSLPRSR